MDRREAKPSIRSLLRILSLGAALLFCSLIPFGGAAAQGKWRVGMPVPEGANEMLGATLGGKLYLYGGQGPGSRPLGLFFVYDPGRDAWTKLPANPLPVHHGALVAVGTKLYLFGGFRLPDTGRPGWVPVADAWMYDSASGQWSALPPMSRPRGALAAAAVGGKIYLVGGAGLPHGADLPDGLRPGSAIDMLDALEVFDTETTTWRALAPMPTPRNHHSVAAVGNKLYVIGGRVGSCYSGGLSANIWMNDEYDIATDTWTARSPMPTARSGTGIAVIDNEIHVLGGEGWVEDEAGGVFRTHEVYDPKSDSWTRAAPMTTPRAGFAVAAIGEKIYTVSGVNVGRATPPPVADVNEIFVP